MQEISSFRQIQSNSYEDVCLPEVIFRLMDLPQTKHEQQEDFLIYAQMEKTAGFDGLFLQVLFQHVF